MTVTVNDLEYEFYEKALAGTLPGGDGTGRQIIAGGLYATFVERDEYYGAPGNNYPSLFNSESRVTGVSAEGVFQIWGGDEAPASYDPSDWITVTQVGIVGPEDSTVNEIATYNDTAGNALRSNADITANSGALRRATANEDLYISRNGSGNLLFGDAGETPAFPQMKFGGDGVLEVRNGAASAGVKIDDGVNPRLELADGTGTVIADLSYNESGSAQVKLEDKRALGMSMEMKPNELDFGTYSITPDAIENTITNNTFRFVTAGPDSIYEMESESEAELYIAADDNTHAGVNFVVNGVDTKGGVGWNSDQALALKLGNFQTPDEDEGIEITPNQVRVQGIKHYLDGGANTEKIEASSGRNLELVKVNQDVRIGDNAVFSGALDDNDITLNASFSVEGDTNKVKINSVGDLISNPTTPVLELTGPNTLRVPVLNQLQLDASVTGGSQDWGKIAFNSDEQDLEYHDGDQWRGLKQQGNHRSFRAVIGNDLTGPSETAPLNVQREVIQNLPLHSYEIDGAPGSSGDWDSTDGEFVMPSNAPSGYYALNMRGRTNIQSGGTTGGITNVTDESQWLVWMAIGGADPGYPPSGNPDGPSHVFNKFGYTFSDSRVAYLEPGNFIYLLYNCLYERTDGKTDVPWFLDELRFEIVYLGDK